LIKIVLTFIANIYQQSTKMFSNKYDSTDINDSTDTKLTQFVTQILEFIILLVSIYNSFEFFIISLTYLNFLH
jgi:hypothetical protein